MFLDLGKQPLANRFLTPDQFAHETFYNLDIHFCPECLTVQIGDCPDSSEVFNGEYPFFTGTSSRMVQHFADLAGLIKSRYMPEGGLIVEMGSNDGTFLVNFEDVNHVGLDPSSNVTEIARGKGLNVHPYSFSSSFFDPQEIDVLVSANVFAHIPDRHGVLDSIKESLALEGVWINEEPYLIDIIDGLAYDQFYNEHVFYTSIASMQNVLETHDLEIKDFELIWPHGGSIRYFVGHKTRGDNPKIRLAIRSEGLGNIGVFHKFGTKVYGKILKFKQDITNVKPTAVGYAATAKSTTVLNSCGIGPDLISRIYDTTPDKQGKYSPGSHIPIVPYDQFKIDAPENVVLFAWNHTREILKKEAGFNRNWIMPTGGHV